MTLVISQPLLDLRAVLLDGLRKEYNKAREGVHVSDLVTCPRQACFQRIKGKREFTDRTLMYFVGGEFVHQKLQQILGPDFDCEKEFLWHGILCHPDAVNKKDGAVIEIKTARTDSVIKAPKEHHLLQLKMYMAITGAPYGILQYIILNNYDNCFPSHFVFFTDIREEEEMRARILADSAELSKGIENKDPSKVRHIAYDLDYMIKRKDGSSTGANWMCGSCEFAQECMEMRAKERIGNGNGNGNAEMKKVPESWRPK